MSSPFGLPARWSTAWSGMDILVLRNGVERDRIYAPDIVRIVFAQSTGSEAPGGSDFALVELADEVVVIPAAFGLAARVHFERQAFWAAKACVYWTDAADAVLPDQCRPRRGFGLGRREVGYARLDLAEVRPLLQRWQIEGPQSWQERRWQGSDRLPTFSRPAPEGRAEALDRPSRF